MLCSPSKNLYPKHVQVLYDLAAASLGPSSQNGTSVALPQLYTEGFDTEQIWLQLDMQVGAAWPHSSPSPSEGYPAPGMPSTQELLCGMKRLKCC